MTSTSSLATSAVAAPLLDLRPVRQISPAADVWRRFRRNRLALAGLALVAFLALTAALAPVIAPYDPLQVDLDRQRGHVAAAVERLMTRPLRQEA